MSHIKPTLKEYLDIHQFLADLYAFRKQCEPQFSYETWSQELDIEHRSYLRQIVIGRRKISNSMESQLAYRLGLQGTDIEYFRTLNSYTKSKNSEQKNIFGKRLAQLIRVDVAQVSLPESGGFVMHPLIPRLHAYLTFTDAPTSIEELALRFSVNIENMSAFLRVLQEANLIEITSMGPRAKSKTFVVPDKLGNVDLLNYHRLSLQDAIDATSMEVGLRRYKSLLVALTQEEFQTYLDDLQEFTRQTLSKFNSDLLGDRKLFQVNYNIHAVSK